MPRLAVVVSLTLRPRKSFFSAANLKEFQFVDLTNLPTERTNTPHTVSDFARFPVARSIERLEAAERALQSTSSDSETTFRSKSRDIRSSLGRLYAEKTALRQAESALTAILHTLGGMAKVAMEEEKLRAVVPAGSGR